MLIHVSKRGPLSIPMLVTVNWKRRNKVHFFLFFFFFFFFFGGGGYNDAEVALSPTDPNFPTPCTIAHAASSVEKFADINMSLSRQVTLTLVRERDYHEVPSNLQYMSHQISSLLFTQPFFSGADQRKHQSSASLAFVRGIHRWPVNSPHKRPVT